MKKALSILTAIILSCFGQVVYAEETEPVISSSIVTADSGFIHYNAPVTISMDVDVNLSIYSASLQSMLDLEPSVFSTERVVNWEHRRHDDFEYPIEVEYFEFADGSTLLLSSNGRIDFSTPIGSALHQLYQSYGYQLPYMEAINEDSVLPVLEQIDLPYVLKPRVAYSLTRDQAMHYASLFDAEYTSYFGAKGRISLEQIISNCLEGSTYIQLQNIYDGHSLGNYSYTIHSSERFIEMSDAVAIINDNRLVFLSLPAIYSVSGTVSEVSSIYTLQEAIEYFENKANESLLFEELTVYGIALELGVSATGSGQDDFLIQPTWHFSVIPTSVLDNTDEEYLDAALISSTRHFVFNAENGQWISW